MEQQNQIQITHTQCVHVFTIRQNKVLIATLQEKKAEIMGKFGRESYFICGSAKGQVCSAVTAGAAECGYTQMGTASWEMAQSCSGSCNSPKSCPGLGVTFRRQKRL